PAVAVANQYATHPGSPSTLRESRAHHARRRHASPHADVPFLSSPEKNIDQGSPSMVRTKTTLIASMIAPLLLSVAARADVAQDWNNIALDLQSRGNSPANAALFGNAVNSNPGT